MYGTPGKYRVTGVRVFKWGNGLAVWLRKALVAGLGLKPGDELAVVAAQSPPVLTRDERRALAVERMRERALPIPDDHGFNREQAHAR